MRGLSRLLLIGGLIAFLLGMVWVGKGAGYISQLPEVVSRYHADYLTPGMALAAVGIFAIAISAMF